MNDTETVDFFGEGRRELILVDVKPKLSKESEKRIRLDFSMKLTAQALETAPENVKEAFYAVTKDSLGLNPIGITSEFQDAVINFYATMKTKSPSLEVGGCTIRQLSVHRPEKADLDDGDVRLKFHINVPASTEVWAWCYPAYGTEMAAEFEELQPLLPHIKAANPDSDGQGILGMEASDPQPTVVPDKTKKKPTKKASKKK